MPCCCVPRPAKAGIRSTDGRGRARATRTLCRWLASSSVPKSLDMRFRKGRHTVTLRRMLAWNNSVLGLRKRLTCVAEDPSLWMMQYPAQHFLHTRWVRSMQESHWQLHVSVQLGMARRNTAVAYVVAAFPAALCNAVLHDAAVSKPFFKGIISYQNDEIPVKRKRGERKIEPVCAYNLEKACSRHGRWTAHVTLHLVPLVLHAAGSLPVRHW